MDKKTSIKSNCSRNECLNHLWQFNLKRQLFNAWHRPCRKDTANQQQQTKEKMDGQKNQQHQN